ncbi:Uncharacterised protein [Serratia marcescens]|nr:Uncharacterised protein [Serratia marcescens]
MKTIRILLSEDEYDIIACSPQKYLQRRQTQIRESMSLEL